MWIKHGTIGAALLAFVAGCETPAEERAEIAAERTEARVERERAQERAEERREEQEERARASAERARQQEQLAQQRPAQEPMAGMQPTAPGAAPCVDPNDPACIAQQQAQQQNIPPEQRPMATTRLMQRETDADMSTVVARLSRAMRDNDLEVLTTVRYDQSARERALRAQQPMGQQPTQAMGQQPTEPMAQQPMAQQPTAQEPAAVPATDQIGDVRVVIYRRVNAESQMIDSHGIAMLLDAPRQIAIFERGGKVVVAYHAPATMPMAGEEEPVAQILDRITTEITQPPQETAQARVPRREPSHETMEPEEPMGAHGTTQETDLTMSDMDAPTEG